MKIFITGIHGFVGAQLATYLQMQGCIVAGSTHKPSAASHSSSTADFTCNETSPPQTAWFSGCDTIIHCAYDPAPGSVESNLKLTRQLFDAAASAGVPHQIFVSSHSARPDAYGEYGRQKYQLEQFFLSRQQTIIRPGLIIGPGGLFARMQKQLLSLPVLLLPAPRQLPVFYIGLDDLLASIWQITKEKRRGAFNLFAPAPMLLQDFARAITNSGNKRKIIIPIPLDLINGLLSLAETLTSTPPTALARLFTARQNIQNPDYHQSDLLQFVESPANIKTCLPEHTPD